MKQFKSILVALLLALVVQSCTSEKAALLKLDLKKGKTYDFETTLSINLKGQGQEIKSNIISGYRMAVEELRDDEQVVTCSYTRIMIDNPMPGISKVAIDTDDLDTTKLQGKVFGAMIGPKFTLILSSAGKVKEIRGMKELYNHILAKIGASDSFKPTESMQKFLSGESLKQDIEQRFSFMPAKEVQVGDIWEKEHTALDDESMKMKTIYTVKEIKDDYLIVDLDSKFDQTIVDSDGRNIVGGMIGTLEVLKDAGFPLNFNTELNFNVYKDSKEEIVVSVKMKMIGKVR